MKLPKDWSLQSMNEIGEVQAGRQRSPHLIRGGMRPYLRVANVQDGWIDFTDVKEMPFTDKEAAIYQLAAGDILLSEGQSLELVGRPAMYRGEINGCCFQNTLVRLRTKRHSPEFVLHLCKHLFVNGVFQRIAKKTTSIAHLGVSRFADLQTAVPPLPEQRKIADILGTWDEALEKLDALIAAKERRTRTLMQQLLTGRKRLNGFGNKWRTVTLGELIRPNIRPVAKPTSPFLSAGIRSHNRGVFLKPDFKPADIALDELFELKAGDLVANITFAWEGALAIVPPEADGALVSHRFPTFELLPGSAAFGFFRHLIRTKRFVFHCGLASPGGAGRNRVLSKTEFLKIPISVPSFEEQTAIGEILDACNEESLLLRNQRDALDRQKRGLMQRLLTGKLRVKTQ